LQKIAGIQQPDRTLSVEIAPLIREAQARLLIFRKSGRDGQKALASSDADNCYFSSIKLGRSSYSALIRIHRAWPGTRIVLKNAEAYASQIGPVPLDVDQRSTRTARYSNLSP
jgi:hypothetical protein